MADVISDDIILEQAIAKANQERQLMGTETIHPLVVQTTVSSTAGGHSSSQKGQVNSVGSVISHCPSAKVALNLTLSFMTSSLHSASMSEKVSNFCFKTKKACL